MPITEYNILEIEFDIFIQWLFQNLELMHNTVLYISLIITKI